MGRRFTVLRNPGLGKVMVLDPCQVRYNRMRNRISTWANVLNVYSDIKLVMVTLTYSPEHTWEPNHIKAFMRSMRRTLTDRLWGYAWVAELQKRGAIHYHVMLVVPNDLVVGEDLPYPDEAGLWPYGFTRTETARTVFYLVTYLGKEYQKDFSAFPKGIRVFAVYIRQDEAKLKLRYDSLPSYQQAFVDEFGWSELASLIRLRKAAEDAANKAWRLESLGISKEAAVKRAGEWESLGHEWKGRRMFTGGGDG
jgi:hypothetical protein